MENVMTNAWEIAYKGKNEFGGKVKEYFAQALRLAWAIFKKEEKQMNYADQVKGTLGTVHLPELQGTVKQVEWAKGIRKNALDALFGEVFYEEWKDGYPKRSVKALAPIMASEESIEKYLEGKTGPDAEGTVEMMNNLLDRYSRFSEIASQTDVRFWIDNRDNQEKNYMFKEFIEYVSTGIKNF